MTKSISHHRSESTSAGDILSQVKTSPDSSPKSRDLEDLGWASTHQIPLTEARGKADSRNWRRKGGG